METIPGGLYIVGENFVNANGTVICPVKKGRDYAVRMAAKIFGSQTVAVEEPEPKPATPEPEA